MNILAISPHLDDAVFSVGGLLHKAVKKGWDCSVITCFTESVLHPTGFALQCQTDKGLAIEVDYMKLRRQEDKEACKLLGLDYQWLSFKEAPHRGYMEPKALFQQLLPEDTIHHDLEKKLNTIICEKKPDIILFPYGIGNHVDHQQVVKAVKNLKQEFPKIRFYQWFDEPYYSKVTNSKEFKEQTTRFEMDKELLNIKALEFNVTSEFEEKALACKAYTSQFNFQFKEERLLYEVFDFARNDTGSGSRYVERLVQS
ncbi:PIG-L family deacetylase [Aquimarina sp. ERC-38]|uniref:PIG-L deacetylase family protein n=1 Tax=Aquimarina sp. ERC-38 TaxID=2949996 RepID=UPI00224562FB|nr:PIG-L family deacetylase [Aquimarina sp. ERC-38]UZO79269.1 PIG-L family deacetylase [Aquimarina sp. ERC-38]